MPINVHIPFAFDNGDGTSFSDAIVMPLAEYNALPAAEKKRYEEGKHAQQKERHTNWKKTLDEMKAQSEREARMAEIEQRKAELEELQRQWDVESVPVEPEA